jgi:hypothetical protein
MRDCTSAARLALYRNLSMKACMCLRFMSCASAAALAFFIRSRIVFSKLS